MSDRSDRALSMRREGQTYAQIGQALGVTRARAHQLVAPPVGVRAEVVRMANETCQECGEPTGTSGQMHHIDINAEPFNDIKNLRLLCLACHRAAHNTNVGPKQRTTIELPWEMYQDLREASDNHITKYVRQAIAEKLERETE